MKTRITTLKTKVDQIIEDKNNIQKVLLAFPIAIGSLGYIVGTGVVDLYKFLEQKRKDRKEQPVKETKTEKFETQNFNNTVELTKEVDINSDKLFEEVMSATGMKPEKEVEISEDKEESKDEIASEVDPNVHAHVQSLKEQHSSTVSEDVITAKEAEKARLEAIKAKMIHNAQGEEDKGTLTQDEKINILQNLGYVSPTRGRTDGYTELEVETEPEINTEEFIISSVQPIEELEAHDELIADIAFDFHMEDEEVMDEVTREIKLLVANLEETIDNTLDIVAQTTEVTIEEVESTKEIEEDFEPIVADWDEKTEEFIKEEAPEVKEEIEEVAEETTEEVVEEATEEQDFSGFIIPGSNLLDEPKENTESAEALESEMKIKSEQLNDLFVDFKVGAKVSAWNIGPTVTTFEIEIEAGTKITKITGLEDNIKLQLQAKDIRIQAPIPGKAVVGIEIPNQNRKPVGFSLAWKEAERKNEDLLIVAGQDVNGKTLTFDLAKTPHLLVAGSTGSGKSVAINTVLGSLLLGYTPEDLQLILVDPKMVEFTPYHEIPHLITPVITNPTDANIALKEAVNIMEDRYKMMAENGARNIKELNEKMLAKGENKLPYLVIIVDELADLMMVAAKEVEESIMRITQKARAAGIHMIVATQRPSTDVITGVIKSNIPSRIAFTVASSIDSRTILDATGAEKLVGMGDMLLSLYGELPMRGQGAYISTEEVDRITDFVKEQGKPNYKINVQAIQDQQNSTLAIDESDPTYQAAKELVIKQRKASVSLLQRYLSIGYNKAANIIDALEADGVIGPSQGSKPREVLISGVDEQ